MTWRADRGGNPPATVRMSGAASHAGHPTRDARRHTFLPHTADVGITAVAPDLPALFEESALALSELSCQISDEPTGSSGQRPGLREEAVELVARDLVSLAFLWLNELIGLGDLRRAAVVGATVERVELPSGKGDRPHGTRLLGRIRLVPFDDVAVRPRIPVKSATFHRLVVRPARNGWRLAAYLDV